MVPRQSYLKRIDPDGTWRFEDVKAEVVAMSYRYFNLVLEPKSARGKAELEHSLISTLDAYESFHLPVVRRQSRWAEEDRRVELAEDLETEEEPETAKDDPPPQIPASCTCKWCCKWTVCQHMSLVASVFSPAYKKVPDKLVAETPALRKKTNSIRGTAGVRREVLIKEIARQKSATKAS